MADDLTRASLPQRALSGHAAVGLLAGGLIYLVALSGMLAVMQERWQRWEDPHVAEMPSASPSAVQMALEHKLSTDGKATEHTYIMLPKEGLPRLEVMTDHGARYYAADASPDRPSRHTWTDFLLDQHYYLNLPMTPGLVLTGVLAVMLLVLTVNGVMAHPRIFRDAFQLRIKGQRQLARTDWHNRLGVWTLPFIVTLALTGAMMGVGLLVVQAVALDRHDGDVEKAYAPIFGEHPAHDPRPAPTARVDAAMRWMSQHHPELPITFVAVEEPQTAGQQIIILADQERRLVYAESFLFDGDGRFLGMVGLSDGPLGQQAIASIYYLHFGAFGGVPVLLAYIIFGLGLCVITGTGMTIWLQKRRARGLAEPRLEAFWAMVIWGSPTALLLTAWLRFVTNGEATLAPWFWGGLGAACLVAVLRPGQWIKRSVPVVLAAGLAVTGIAHWAYYPHQALDVAFLDLGLVLASIGIIITVSWSRRRQTAARNAVHMEATPTI